MQLSKIKYPDLLFKTSQEDLAKIVFMPETISQITKCDVGILHGGISMLPSRADKAIDLYKNGLIDYILCTGGIGYFAKDKTPESIIMQDYLRSKGVANSRIITETNSRNTEQNIYYSLALLSNYFDLDNTSLAVITSDFRLKRTLGLYQHYLGNIDITAYETKDYLTDKKYWYKTIYGQRVILNEALALLYAAKKGKIPDEEISLTRKK